MIKIFFLICLVLLNSAISGTINYENDKLFNPFEINLFANYHVKQGLIIPSLAGGAGNLKGAQMEKLTYTPYHEVIKLLNQKIAWNLRLYTQIMF